MLLLKRVVVSCLRTDVIIFTSKCGDRMTDHKMIRLIGNFYDKKNF